MPAKKTTQPKRRRKARSVEELIDARELLIKKSLELAIKMAELSREIEEARGGQKRFGNSR